jgi:hypothetical protein
MEIIKKMAWLLFVLLIIVEIVFRPRIDRTRDGDLLLWYGRRKRNYIKL